MDATLVTGVLSIGGAFATGLLSLCGFVAKRIVAAFDTLASSNVRSADNIGLLASEMKASREEAKETTRTHGDRLEDLEKTIQDRRLSDVAAAIGNITGNHMAVTVERAEQVDEPRHARRALASRPAR